MLQKEEPSYRGSKVIHIENNKCRFSHSIIEHDAADSLKLDVKNKEVYAETIVTDNALIYRLKNSDHTLITEMRHEFTAGDISDDTEEDTSFVPCIPEFSNEFAPF